jgi:hypothetical protein
MLSIVKYQFGSEANSARSICHWFSKIVAQGWTNRHAFHDTINLESLDSAKKKNWPGANAQECLAQMRGLECPACEVPRGAKVIVIGLGSESKSPTLNSYGPRSLIIFYEQKRPTFCKRKPHRLAIRLSHGSIILSLTKLTTLFESS